MVLVNANTGLGIGMFGVSLALAGICWRALEIVAFQNGLIAIGIIPYLIISLVLLVRVLPSPIVPTGAVAVLFLVDVWVGGRAMLAGVSGAFWAMVIPVLFLVVSGPVLVVVALVSSVVRRDRKKDELPPT